MPHLKHSCLKVRTFVHINTQSIVERICRFFPLPNNRHDNDLRKGQRMYAKDLIVASKYLPVGKSYVFDLIAILFSISLTILSRFRIKTEAASHPAESATYSKIDWKNIQPTVSAFFLVFLASKENYLWHPLLSFEMLHATKEGTLPVLPKPAIQRTFLQLEASPLTRHAYSGTCCSIP